MSDLTPELLAQLEEDVQGFPGRWESRFDDESDSIYYIDREGEAHEIAPDIEIEDVADQIARMLNALPALVAAAKERDTLASAKAEIAAWRYAAQAVTDRVAPLAVPSGPELLTQLDANSQLMADAYQAAGETSVRHLRERDALAAHVRALLQVIDRKSYSSAAQQEAVRAAEAAIGGVSDG